MMATYCRDGWRFICSFIFRVKAADGGGVTTTFLDYLRASGLEILHARRASAGISLIRGNVDIIDVTAVYFKMAFR